MAKRKTKARPDPVTDYARSVVAGKIVAGKLVVKACERHLRDLKTAKARGFVWDLDQVDIIFDFFRLLKHSKGRWAGQPFELSPWQQFFVGSVWGWRRTDGTRRFRVAHVEVARKNGKTTLAAGLELAMLLIDGEPGAEVYCAATKKDQAKLTHIEAERMVKRSPALAKRIDVLKNNLSIPSTSSKAEPLGADSDTLDGLNVSGAVCDELHAWKQRKLWDVIETATGARLQPLIVCTTTAGYDTHSIWWELRSNVARMLDAKTPSDDGWDDELFGLIYTLDVDDDWTDEAVWIKGNPNLGVTVKAEDLRKGCRKAQVTPGRQPAFRRLRLNQITEAASVWIDINRWDDCRSELTEDDLVGRVCFGGLDLSSSRDLTAAFYFFPMDPEEIEGAEGTEKYLACVTRFWLPEEDLRERCEQDGKPYDQWADEGWITLIPGPAIRYEVVEEHLKQDAEKFQHLAWGVDRWMAVQTSRRLIEEGFNIQEYRQSYVSMAAPVVEFERAVASRRILHLGCPVLRMCVANTIVDQDSVGNRKPTKKKSTGRIDGVVAAMMAMGVMLSEEGQSVYASGMSLEC